MSENKKYYYLKLKENFFNRKDILLLESMREGITYTNILLKLYLISLEFDGQLRLNESVVFTPEMLAPILHCEIGTLKETLKIFNSLGLTAVLYDNVIYMTEIEGMVGSSSTEADRKRIARNKIKLLKADKCPLNVRTLSENRPPEIEIEKEIDKESEIESERELYGRYKNVSLTRFDYENLLSDYPAYAEKYIERLSSYMASKGKSYRNHCATIRSWLEKDIKTSSYTCEDGDSL